MNVVLDLSTLLNTFAAAGILGVFRELYQLNHQVGKIQTWADQHDHSDTERFQDLRGQLSELRGESRQ